MSMRRRRRQFWQRFELLSPPTGLDIELCSYAHPRRARHRRSGMVYMSGSAPAREPHGIVIWSTLQ